jgi:AraC-like DNA-binding protein
MMSPPGFNHPPTRLAKLLDGLRSPDGFGATVLPDVRLLRSTHTHLNARVSYGPSLVIVAQGRKQGRLGTRTFTYDPQNYLVLSVPLPFECETHGTPEEPMLGIAVQIHLATIAELILEQPPTPSTSGESQNALAAAPLTPEMSDAALRLATCLYSPNEARILGPQIVREMTYRALCGPQGIALRAFAAPQHRLGQIARALRRMHSDYADTLDVGLLAQEAGMGVSTFHAHFKAVTAQPPQRYLQTIRLHKAQALMAGGASVAEAAHQVGYESPSQFSREFKRLFGGSPKAVITRYRSALSLF